jgi:SAM-dependent methyltransferase
LRGEWRDLRGAIGAWLERETRQRPPARRLRFQLVLEAIDGHAAERQLRVLDAGAGDSLLAIATARRHHDWKITAADVDDALLDRGRRLSEQMNLSGIEFVRADLTADLGSDRFDLVLAIECLEEIPDDDAALLAMARALRPGGRLIAHVPERNWVPVLPGSSRTWRHEVRHGYGADELAAKLEHAGLVVARVAPTARGAVFLGQEIADRIKHRRLAIRVAALPITAGLVRLERWGLTWGPSRALLAEAVRPPL